MDEQGRQGMRMLGGDRGKETRHPSLPARGTRPSIHWGGIALTLGTALVCAVGMLDLARRVAMITPTLGDLIVFAADRPGLQDPVRLVAGRAGQVDCALDVAAMRESGGSLIVEQRWPGENPLYRVHWSGLRTSGDARNCGADADLLLRGSDLQVLATAVGGFGQPRRQAIPLMLTDLPPAPIP